MKKVFKSQEGRASVLAIYDRVLEGFNLDMASELIHTSLGQTHIYRYGDRSLPPLLLIHGTGSNAASFVYALEKLGKKYHVILPDIPGEPGRSEDRRFPCDGNFFTNWISELMDALCIETFHIGGQSLGAWASLRFSIDRPERVLSALLISPSGLAPLKGSYWFFLIFSLIRGEKGINHLIGRMLNSESREIDPQEYEVFQIIMKQTRFREDQPPLFTDSELKSLRTPLLYTGGMKDILLNTKKSSERLQKAVPDVKCIILREGGHALNSWVKDFLAFTP